MGADELVGILAPTEVTSEQGATNMNIRKHESASKQMIKKKKKKVSGSKYALQQIELKKTCQHIFCVLIVSKQNIV